MDAIPTKTTTEFSAEERKILDLIFQEKAHESAVISNEVKLPHNKVLAVLWDLRNRGILTRRVHNESPVTFHLVEGKYRPGPPPVVEDPKPLDGHLKALNGIDGPDIDPSKFTTEALENMIIDAIKAKFRTLNGIKRKVGFPKAFDVSKILHDMRERNVIKQLTNATCTASFLWDEYPINNHFWITGDGTVAADFPTDTPVSQAAPPIEADKKAVSKPKPQAHVSGSTHGRYKHIDPNEAEQVAAEHGTLTAVAKHFGMTPSGLSSKLRRETDLKARIQTGLDTNTANSPGLNGHSKPVDETPGTVTTETDASMPNQIEDLEPHQPQPKAEHSVAGDFKVLKEAGDIEVLKEAGVITDSQLHLAKMTDEVLEELAFQGLTVREAGNQLDIPYNTFTYHLYKKGSENRHFKAWERGKAKRVAELEDFIAPKTEPAAGTFDQSLVPSGTNPELRQMDSVELGKQVLETIRDIKVADAAARSIPNQTFVKLGQAGNLVVAFDGNFFAASPAQRNLMNQIADLIQEHEEANAGE